MASDSESENHKPPHKHHSERADNDFTPEDQLLYCKTHNEKY